MTCEVQQRVDRAVAHRVVQAAVGLEPLLRRRVALCADLDDPIVHGVAQHYGTS